MLIMCSVAGSRSPTTLTANLRITSTQSHASIDARCPTAECTAVCTSSLPLVMGRHSVSSLRRTQILYIRLVLFFCYGGAFISELKSDAKYIRIYCTVSVFRLSCHHITCCISKIFYSSGGKTKT